MDSYSDVMYISFKGELKTKKVFCAYSLFDTFDRDIESVYLDQNPNNTNYNPDYDLGSTLPISTVSEVVHDNPLFIERIPVTTYQTFDWGRHVKPFSFSVELEKPVGKTQLLKMELRLAAEARDFYAFGGRRSGEFFKTWTKTHSLKFKGVSVPRVDGAIRDRVDRKNNYERNFTQITEGEVFVDLENSSNQSELKSTTKFNENDTTVGTLYWRGQDNRSSNYQGGDKPTYYNSTYGGGPQSIIVCEWI